MFTSNAKQERGICKKKGQKLIAPKLKELKCLDEWNPICGSVVVCLSLLSKICIWKRRRRRRTQKIIAQAIIVPTKTEPSGEEATHSNHYKEKRKPNSSGSVSCGGLNRPQRNRVPQMSIWVVVVVALDEADPERREFAVFAERMNSYR